MFTLSINISFPSLGGVTFESQLSTIRGKLSEVNKTIRDLESNFILFLIHPEIVLINNAKKSRENNGEENTYSQQMPTTFTKTYSADPSEVRTGLSEAWSLKKALFSNEYDLLQKIMTEFKRDGEEHTNISNNII